MFSIHIRLTLVKHQLAKLHVILMVTRVTVLIAAGLLKV
ncbi:hypothetical protein M636_12745 [Vibrio parahaemolyticus O1:K33 str. CDC_K4557]|nr:hypothetical protein M636_12745 [Vibrio parahaemolyticus O1:K33 str. CDC_K4557]